MALLGRWTGGSTSLLPGTSWAAPSGMFPTESRNDGYTFSSASSLVTLPASGLANGYLVVGSFELEDTSNGRANPQGRIVQSSGTGNYVGQSSTGYNRDNSEDRSYVRAWGFIDNPSAGAQLQFQWRRDTDVPTGGTVRSEFWVIPLYYSDIGLYSSTSNACPGGTTLNQITGFSGVDGANITLAGNAVTVSGDNKRYIALGGAYWQGVGNARTQRWKGLRIDGVQENAAKAYSYGRNAANADIGDLFTWLIETGTADRSIDSSVYRGDGVANLQGGANVDGNTTGSNAQHALVVIELNDSAEVFASRATSQSANLTAAGPIDLDIAQTLDINDASSFTQSSNSGINVEQDCDVLFGANISGASNNVSTGARYTGFAELTVDGVEDPNSVAGDYLRNNQGTQDTFGWSANLLGAQAVTTGQDLGISVTELPGSEGGGNMVSPAGWSGFWGVNLDSLQSSGSGASVEVPVGGLLITGHAPEATVSGRVYWAVYPSAQADPTASEIINETAANGVFGNDSSPITTSTLVGSVIGSLASGTSYKLASVWSDGSNTSNVAVSSTFTTTSASVSVEVPAGGLEITGLAPTVAVTANASVEIPAGQLTITGYAPQVSVTQNVSVEVPAESLSITGYAPEVAVGGRVYWAVYPSSQADPADSDIIAGTVANGIHGNDPSPVSNGTLIGQVIAGLAPGTSYRLASVWYDGTNTSNVAISPIFSTDSGSISVSVPAGSLDVVGFAPTVSITQNVAVEVPAASLTIQGYAPTAFVSNSVQVEVPAGSLEITGYAPTVAVSENVSALIPAGALTIQGYAPVASVTSNVTVEIPAGSLEITTFAPQAGVSVSVEVPSGGLEITGHPPTAIASFKKVVCTLVDANGVALPNLIDLSFAWFDEPDPADFTTAVVQGVTESTDGTGEIEVEVGGTSLDRGELGTLVLRSNDGVSLGAYNLEVL